MTDVLTGFDDGVGTITLNRPNRRNALSTQMVTGLVEALSDMEADTRIGAIVLTGAGGAFCAGGDVQRFHDSGGEGGGADEVDPAAVARQQATQEATVGRIHRCRKPVLASIPGAAAGAGMGLALAADLRIGCARTVFATAFADVGLAGDFGVAWLLDRVVGPATARELMLLNPRVRGEDGVRLGLLNWCVADDVLSERTQEIAARLARGPSRALESMKQNLLRAPREDLSTFMQTEVELHKASGVSPEHVRAVASFVAKEKPTFATGWHEEQR